MKTSWLIVWLLLGLTALVVALALMPTVGGTKPEELVEEASVSDEAAPGEAPPGMVWIPSGSFWMGSDAEPNTDRFDESPRHLVKVDGFWADRTEVTNAEFAKFVAETEYLTVAERPIDLRDLPHLDLKGETIPPASAVFKQLTQRVPMVGSWEQGPPPWWQAVRGANWRHPEGPNSNITGRENYPAVQICWEDAAAYAKWANKRLPTEAEWEYAVRGGLDREEFAWGSAKQGEAGVYRANTWQGEFPIENSGADGFLGLAPVGSFPANGFGLLDVSGNAWEWCDDWYQPDYYARSPKKNPKGPLTGDPQPGEQQPQRVRRGGSFLCADNYCRRYLPAARDKNPPDSAANHTGFRCVR